LAFAESIDPRTQRKRGAAWGGGLGLVGLLGSENVSFGLDFFLGVSSPEVLAILPSAVGHLQMQTGFFLRIGS
jgi:hypothetical protein